MRLSRGILLTASMAVLAVVATCTPATDVNLYAELDRILRILNPERPAVYIPDTTIAVPMLACMQYTALWVVMCFINRYPVGAAKGPQCYNILSLVILFTCLLMFVLMQTTAPWAFGALLVYGLLICLKQLLAYIDNETRKMFD